MAAGKQQPLCPGHNPASFFQIAVVRVFHFNDYPDVFIFDFHQNIAEAVTGFRVGTYVPVLPVA